MSGPIDLRLGRWQDVLADVTTCDAVICDPPYSARTHEGARSINGVTAGVTAYAAWSPSDVEWFLRFWVPRCRGWIVIATDDVLGPVARDVADELGRCREKRARFSAPSPSASCVPSSVTTRAPATSSSIRSAAPAPPPSPLRWKVAGASRAKRSPSTTRSPSGDWRGATSHAS